MLFQGQVVNKVPNARQTGNPNALQLPLGELGISEVLPRYSSLAASGMVFTAYAAAVATSVTGTGLIGLQLWNRSNSVNLHLLKCAGDVIVTSATTTGFALAFGTAQTTAPSGQTAITSVTNNLLGAAAPAALALNAGTFATTPAANWLLMHNTAAIASTGEDQGFLVDFEGSIIVPPNAFVAIVALGAAVAASGSNLHLMWAEVPV